MMQNIGNIVLWAFAAIAVMAAVSVVLAKNPIRAVLSLIVTFLATAVTWLMLQAEFLAITLILVYVGAVMVLFLFVVMMLDIGNAVLQARFTRWFPIGVVLALSLFYCIASVLLSAHLRLPEILPILSYAPSASNTQLLGKLVFTDYLLQFEIAGVLLLVAIIAAIGLIYRGPQARKIQQVFQQVSVDPKKRVRLVDGT